ncbi:MAG: ribose 5-phosphate isomerase A [Gammaproteobacteria bacterium]|nr:ribose 5-phosphate isomerase A [Gammaproteobacteria bacterium]HJL95392.1 ribose-5-phosphate isomerase RpiA [SAR86 cluster bacterium]|tara:strand:- start:2135 stop:2809 length:675 start_codon:yes stop_codon:yes gene_type:complete
MNQDLKKKSSAIAAFELILPKLNKDTVLGIGTGSTTNFFIEELNASKVEIKGAVCSSAASESHLSKNITIISLNEVHAIDFYIDGADEYNDRFELIKGGGGALTREKILAYSSDMFICIVDDSKHSDLLGKFPLPIEVIEIARSAISREVMKMGGRPVYRNDFITDNGNQIIDVHNMPMDIPFEVENKINNIPGVVENGIFSNRKADVIIKANEDGNEVLCIEK